MRRPPTPNEAEPGYWWQAVVDDDWTTKLDRIAVSRQCRCRETVQDARGSRPVAHAAPIAAALRRRYGRSGHRWWGYCADHLYGRWIEGGVVMHWRLRRAGS